jgi:hypothetical protein
MKVRISAHYQGGVEQEVEDGARSRGFYVSAASMRQGCRQGVSPLVFPGIQSPNAVRNKTFDLNMIRGG